jgi:hypothetical protein
VLATSECTCSFDVVGLCVTTKSTSNISVPCFQHVTYKGDLELPGPHVYASKECYTSDKDWRRVLATDVHVHMTSWVYVWLLNPKYLGTLFQHVTYEGDLELPGSHVSAAKRMPHLWIGLATCDGNKCTCSYDFLGLRMTAIFTISRYPPDVWMWLL